MPARYGGVQAPWQAILDRARRMAHGCASSAWTLGFYTLHNWMMALFGEEAQQGGVRDAPLPGARTPCAAGRRWHQAVGALVVGDRRDARQLGHRRRAVRP